MKKIILLFAVILTVFLFVLPAYAADITLSSSCTLADAIIAANSDRAKGDCPAGRGADTITLAEDITLQAALPAITSDITIEGKGYTISGDNRYRIFYNDGGALTINDLTMTKGYVEGELILNADFTLKATETNPVGGAIANWEGTLTISGNTFSGNSAERGGVIFNAAELSIINSTFSGSNGADNGGAIFNAYGGELNINTSSFNENSAEDGGAINSWGELSISDSVFTDNSAIGVEDDPTFLHLGGVISNWWGKLSITNSSFSGNSADWGGAIFNRGDLTINNSTFTGNSAEGGAITNWDATVSISDSTFSGNSADGFSGGVIYNGGDGTLNISDSTFTGNSAEEGGAIDNVFGELSISDSVFNDNSADVDGGVIKNWGDGNLTISNSSFNDNSAEEGGAINNWG